MNKMPKSKIIQNVTNKIWKILIDNFDAILEYEPALYVYKTIGNRGKGVRSREYSYQFIKQLETKEIVKRLSIALDELKEKNPKLYSYIWLKANGYSHREIDRLSLDVFSEHNFTKKKYRAGRDSYVATPTAFSKKMVRQARDFLIQNSTLEIENKYNQYITKGKRPDRMSLTICPNCEGKGCKTCNDSGDVPFWFAEKMRPKVEAGTWIP
jgi:hypothetical protein